MIMVRISPTDADRTAPPSFAMTLGGVWKGIGRLLPVAVFVVPFGLAFGAAAVEQGLTAAQAMTMSALVFAGASQFAALDLWQAPLPYLSLALVVLAVNARHIILGAALSVPVNALPRPKRFLALALLSDANFADSQAAIKAGARDLGILVGGGAALWATWVAGTAVGAFAGSSIGALEPYGVDVVMAAFFAAVVAGGLKARGRFLPVATACLVAVATFSFLPTGWNIIVAALCGGAVTALRHAE